MPVFQREDCSLRLAYIKTPDVLVQRYAEIPHELTGQALDAVVKVAGAPTTSGDRSFHCKSA